MNSRSFVVLICISLSYLTFAQKVGIQFYQGVNKPLVSFSGDNNALDYSSNFNSDTRLGVFFGDQMLNQTLNAIGMVEDNIDSLSSDIAYMDYTISDVQTEIWGLSTK